METIFEEVMSRIERKLDQHGMSEREASLKAVGKPDLIRDMKRRRGLPTSERMARLANLLGTTTDWLLYGGMEGPILDRSMLRPDGTVNMEARGTDAAANEARTAWGSPDPHRPIPLVRSAFGGEWETDVEMTELRLSEVLDYLGRPPDLQMDPDSYAVEIVGVSMAPRFEPGERAFVSPLSPVRIGDDVVVQLVPEPGSTVGNRPGDRVAMALIKRLTRRTPASLELRQFNPDRTIRVAAEHIAAVHRIRGRF